MSTDKEARFEVAPERMPMIAAAKMTEAQKQAAAEISAGLARRGKGAVRSAPAQGKSLPLPALPLRAKPL